MKRTRYEELMAENERMQALYRWLVAGLLSVALLGLVLGSLAAFGQEASAAPTPAPVVNPEDPGGLALVLLGAIQSGHWGLVVSAALVLVVALLRRFGRGLPKIGPLLDHPVVAWLLPTLASIGGAVVTALVAGTPVSLGLVLSAVVTGLGANALYVGGKKVAEAREAGAAAAAGVDTKAEAVEVLKGPQP